VSPDAAIPSPAAAGQRAAGLLLHPTSLPGRFGIGDIGPTAVAMLDWMASAGLSVWQILPLGPTGYDHSPYNSFSAFAGSPLLLSPEGLAADGLIDDAELAAAEVPASDRVDFVRVEATKSALLRAAFDRFRLAPRPELRDGFEQFADHRRRAVWLDDWALYAAIKRREAGRSWLDWPEGLRQREKRALDRVRRELADEIDLALFEQFLFDRQWRALSKAAKQRGIRILGDVPIYVALDSADVWAHRDLFELDASGRPRAVAGVPPDYFSAEGQRWGNPLYRWHTMARHGFPWWLDRLAHELERTDLFRLDHFRGFVAFWRVPAREKTARKGRWVKGPGERFFTAVRKRLGALPIVAEDLGEIDEPVVALRRKLGLPGMRVLQFGFAMEDSLHAPHRHEPDAVVYTGTHDNDTARGWFAGAGDDERRRALAYLGGTAETISGSMVRVAMASVASLAIVPLQELLDLGGEARMNTPARPAGNWSWRARHEDVPADLPRRLRELVAATARLPPAP
jgi:4-alpha-glucanotransferase